MMPALEIILLAAAGGCALTLALLSALALFPRPVPAVQSKRRRRFAVVIPAHNEERTVGRTVESVLRAEYPRSLFRAIVVADNCTDGTAAAALASGANVLERRDSGRRGKGQALRWCFDRLTSEGSVDAVVVIDADSVVSANILEVLNRALEAGADAVQCSDQVNPGSESWSPGMTRIGFLLYNYARPLGRKALGLSAGLRGNGMCFSARLLKAHPWRAFSRAEDLEYGLHLLLHGIRVVFAPEATVLATMPEDPALAESQRSRWERGRRPVVAAYAPRLLAYAVKRGSADAFFALIDLLTPPLVNFMGIVGGMALLHGAVWLAGVDAAAPYAAWWTAVAGLLLLHVVAGLAAAGADRRTYAVLLRVPTYALWKLLLAIKRARRGDTAEWVRTAREDPGAGKPLIKPPTHRHA